MTKKRTVHLLLLALFLPVGFLPPVQRTADKFRLSLHEALEPIWATAHFFTENVSGGGRRLGEFATLYRDYRLVQEEVTTLRQEIQALREIEKENERLSELLELKKEHPAHTLVGHIITRNLSRWFRWVVIDRGREDGVKERMVLASGQGVVGRVVQVGRSVSECILLTDPESRVSGMLRSSRAVGLVQGEGRSDRLRMSLILLGTEVQIGDAVFTSGLDGVYPKGLVVGEVSMVGAERDGMHMFAYIKPAVDFNMVEEVLCIDSYPAD